MSEKTNEDEQKTERFNMFMSPSEMKAIDEWAWQNKIRSKSEAVRRLCQIGLLVGAELEPLTDVMMEMSSSLTELDRVVTDLWAHINNPIMKGEVLDRAAVSAAVEPIWDEIERTEAGVSDASAVLVALFAAVAGLARSDRVEGARLSSEAIQDVSDQLKKLQDLRSSRREYRSEIKKLGYRKPHADEAPE